MRVRFVLIDCCPVPRRIAAQVLWLKKQTGATLYSCDRSAAAADLLHKCGKHSQAELYALHASDPAHYAAANRPGTSTHERRSDDRAYPAFQLGAKLSSWRVGMDWGTTEVPRLIAAANRRGWKLFQPYPGTSEAHHINFSKRPRIGHKERRRLLRELRPRG
jgi:hypothetical protein